MLVRLWLAGLAALPPTGAALAARAHDVEARNQARASVHALTDLAARRPSRGRPWTAAGRTAWAAKVAAQVRRSLSRAYRDAADRSLEGRVVARFTVTADGHVTAVGLVEASGDTAIDRLALGAIRNVGRLPPPPTGRAENVVAPLSVVGSGR